jgi:hypothetical protein
LTTTFHTDDTRFPTLSPDDGSFTLLKEKDFVVKGYLAALEFIPPWSDSYPNAPHGVMAH